MEPTIARTVLYTLTANDAERVNKRRLDAHKTDRASVQDGVQLHYGNTVREGDVFPCIIVRVWENNLINGQVLLDGNDTLWVTSAPLGSIAPGYWAWPPRV